MKHTFGLWHRRAWWAALLWGIAVIALLCPSAESAAAPRQTDNPFAYDVSHLAKTDPKLIAYREIARWKTPRANPTRLAIGPDDTLYLCSSNYLTAVNPEGKPGREIKLGAVLRCAAVAQDGTIYLGLQDRIVVFDASGKRVATWDSPGGKTWFTGLAVTETNLFAADAGNRVVLRYARTGTLLQRIGEKGPERSLPRFIVPSPYLDVEIGREGLVWVNNPGRHRVEAYTLEGDLELGWGKPSAAMDGFCGCCNPIAIALLPEGRVITAEKGLPRVKVYRAHGEFESVVAGPEAFPENAKAGAREAVQAGLDVAVDSRGRVYVLDLITGEVRVFQRKE